MEKKTKIKIIIIISGAIIILLVFFILMGGKNDVKNAINDYRYASVNSDKAREEALYYMDNTKQTERSSTGTILSSNASNINQENTISTKVDNNLADITDDPDLYLLEETENKLKSGALQKKEHVVNQNTNAITTKKDAIIKPNDYNETTVKVDNKSSENNIKKDDNKNSNEQPKLEEKQTKIKNNRFFEGRRREKKGNTVSCSVHGEQELMNGSTIKLRLLEDYTTPNGIIVPKGSTLWAVCTLNNERMNVFIENVILNKDLISLNLEVYDIDGLKGINLPNSVKAEIAKRTKQEAINQANPQDIIGNNNIVKRGANSVLNAAKSIISKNENQIKVVVKSNYKLMLKPTVI